MEALSQGLHRRQVLDAITKTGLSVSPDSQIGVFLISDAEQRRANLRFGNDGAISITTSDGRTNTRWFDPEGRLRRVVDPAGLDLRIDHDGGETRISRGPHGNYAICQNPFGLTTSVEFPGGAKSSIDWEEADGEVLIDRAGNRSQRLRNKRGEQIGAIDPRGFRFTFTGSRAEGFVERESPTGRSDRFLLDGSGKLSEWLVNGTRIATASGESLPGLPAKIVYSDGRWAEFATVEGRIIAARGSESEVRLQHDGAGRLVTDEQNGAAVTYRRDRTGLLTEVALPDRAAIRFGYDGAGLLNEVIDWEGKSTRIAWGASGQLAAISHPNRVTSQVEADPVSRITALRVLGLDGAALHEGRYEYDPLDRLVAAEEDGVARRYAYDGVDRLTAARASDPALDESWVLDPLGNRLVDNGRPYTADADNRISGQGADAVNWDALGRASELQLPNGRRARLTHDGRGQLVRIDFAGGGCAEYGYDPFGRRIWKRVDGRTTRYLWAGPTLASEVRDPGPGWTRRDHLFLPDLYYPLAMRVDGRTVRLHCDRRGAVVAATDVEGGLVWRARNKAFGEALIDVAQIDQPWRLANQYCDEESGLHYNLARHYHPGLGRYLSQDPLLDPATLGNWYQYAAGDPLGRADPTGEFIIPAVFVAMAVGAVVGAVITAGIKAYETRGQEWNADRWKQIGVAAAVGGVGGAVGAGAGALAVGAMGLAGAVGVGAVLGGAIDGGISSVAQSCAEAAMYDQALSGQQLLKDAAIGAGVGAVTAGIGALIARGFANKAANVAAKKLDDVYKAAKPAKAEIDALSDGIAKKVGGRVAEADLKSPARIMRKANVDYGGDVTRVHDVARNTVVVPRAKIVEATDLVKAKAHKISIVNSTDDAMGYSGVNAKIKTANGHIAEVQVNTPEMIFAKETEEKARSIIGNDVYDDIQSRSPVPGGKGHELYERWQNLPETAENASAKRALEEESQQYYDAIRKIEK